MVLIFDGMRIQANMEYNRMRDDIIGHEDVGPGQTSTKMAENLIVFMIRGIFGSWSEIIAHHFTPSSFPKDRLKKCLMETLSALHSYNLICVGVVCDQEPGHVSLFDGLGVTPDTPFFRCPFSGRRVHLIYDPPHLLKSTRNNFLNYNFCVSTF